MEQNQNTNGSQETIVIDAPAEPTPEPKITVAQATEEGLDPIEIEAGKKHGLFIDDKGTESGKKPEEEEGDKPTADAAAKKDEKKPEGDKDKTKFKSKPWDMTTEEREQAKQWTPNETALYVKQKKEKHRRQEEEGRRRKAELEAAYWKGKAEEAGKRPATKEEPAADVPADDFLDEYGNPPADGEKPVTRADLAKIEKEKEAKAKKEQEAVEARRRTAIDTLNKQEAEFREDHGDFENVYDNFTLKIINADTKALEQLFPNPVERRGVKSMIQDWVVKISNPEKYAGDESAVALAYEIGKLHPEFKPSDADDGDEEKIGNQGDEGSDDEGDDNGADDDTNPLEKRLDKQNRPSSASLSGGANRRPKSLKDLTGDDLALMPQKQFDYLWKNHRSDVERILQQNG